MPRVRKNYVYIGQEKLKQADPKTFKVLGYLYAKDKNRVYWQSEKVEGADAETFQMIEGMPYGYDKNGVYYEGQLLK